MTNLANDQSLKPSTDVIQLTLTLRVFVASADWNPEWAFHYKKISLATTILS